MNSLSILISALFVWISLPPEPKEVESFNCVGWIRELRDVSHLSLITRKVFPEIKEELFIADRIGSGFTIKGPDGELMTIDLLGKYNGSNPYNGLDLYVGSDPDYGTKLLYVTKWTPSSGHQRSPNGGDLEFINLSVFPHGIYRAICKRSSRY